MEKIKISLEGDSAFIDELDKQLDMDGIQRSQPVQKDSLADPLDSPIGADEIKSVTDIITMIISSGTGLLGFIVAFKKVFVKKPKEVIILRDPATGKKLGEVTKDTPEAEIRKMLGQ